MTKATAFAHTISFVPAVLVALISACGTKSSSSQQEPVASASFAITGASFAGNSIRICGSRTPAADPKYRCNSQLSPADAGPTNCPCFNFAADGTLVSNVDGGSSTLTDLCASNDLAAGAPAGTGPVNWTFTYSVFDSPNCMGAQLNDGMHDFACFDPHDLVAQAHPNATVEVLNAGSNTNEVVCETVNANKTFDFTSCAESCIAPAGALPGPSCAETQLECGCTTNSAGTCTCGPDGGLTASALPASCAFDTTTCDILCCPSGQTVQNGTCCSNHAGNSYTQTCSGCSQTGNTLSCSCCLLAAAPICNATSFALCSCPPGTDLANCNGVLTCGTCP
jgi:hypothetical protein